MNAEHDGRATGAFTWKSGLQSPTGGPITPCGLGCFELEALTADLKGLGFGEQPGDDSGVLSLLTETAPPTPQAAPLTSAPSAQRPSAPTAAASSRLRQNQGRHGEATETGLASLGGRGVGGMPSGGSPGVGNPSVLTASLDAVASGRNSGGQLSGRNAPPPSRLKNEDHSMGSSEGRSFESVNRVAVAAGREYIKRGQSGKGHSFGNAPSIITQQQQQQQQQKCGSTLSTPVQPSRYAPQQQQEVHPNSQLAKQLQQAAIEVVQRLRSLPPLAVAPTPEEKLDAVAAWLSSCSDEPPLGPDAAGQLPASPSRPASPLPEAVAATPGPSPPASRVGLAAALPAATAGPTYPALRDGLAAPPEPATAHAPRLAPAPVLPHAASSQPCDPQAPAAPACQPSQVQAPPQHITGPTAEPPPSSHLVGLSSSWLLPNSVQSVGSGRPKNLWGRCSLVEWLGTRLRL